MKGMRSMHRKIIELTPWFRGAESFLASWCGLN